MTSGHLAQILPWQNADSNGSIFQFEAERTAKFLYDSLKPRYQSSINSTVRGISHPGNVSEIIERIAVQVSTDLIH